MKFGENELAKVNGEIKYSTDINSNYTIDFTSEGYGIVNTKEKKIPFFVGYDKQVYFDDESYYLSGEKRLPKYIIEKIQTLSK